MLVSVSFNNRFALEDTHLDWMWSKKWLLSRLLRTCARWPAGEPVEVFSHKSGWLLHARAKTQGWDDEFSNSFIAFPLYLRIVARVHQSRWEGYNDTLKEEYMWKEEWNKSSPLNWPCFAWWNGWRKQQMQVINNITSRSDGFICCRDMSELKKV